MNQTPNHSRREFLKLVSKLGLTAAGVGTLGSTSGLSSLLIGMSSGEAQARGKLDNLIAAAPRARYWVPSDLTPDCSICHDYDNPTPGELYVHEHPVIRCQLCAHACLIKPGERGKCRARINAEGELRTLVYGRPITTHLDPIEKKPFYHFLPGRNAFSMATSGCPLRCKFCQNWQISQSRPEDYSTGHISPQEFLLIEGLQGTPIIAYTYNEPTVFFEYLMDIATQGKRKGKRNVMISCGFMQSEPLRELCEVLDAIKIDLKGFSEDFYRNVCAAELQPVLRSIKQVSQSGIHLEIVNLVVPTLNDSRRMLGELCEWVMGELGPDVPVHFTRFHPDYQMMNLPPTPISTLEFARETALRVGLHYPYVGNVPGHPGNHTFCPACGKIVIERVGFFLKSYHVVEGKCEYCQEPLAGVWS